MHEAYFDDAYITPIAISSTMSSHILHLSKKIKSYNAKVGLEIAPGGV